MLYVYNSAVNVYMFVNERDTFIRSCINIFRIFFAFSQEIGKNEPGVLYDFYSSQQQSA